jgi:hypothetical protein
VNFVELKFQHLDLSCLKDASDISVTIPNRFMGREGSDGGVKSDCLSDRGLDVCEEKVVKGSCLDSVSNGGEILPKVDEDKNVECVSVIGSTNEKSECHPVSFEKEILPSFLSATFSDFLSGNNNTLCENQPTNLNSSQPISPPPLLPPSHISSATLLQSPICSRPSSVSSTSPTSFPTSPAAAVITSPITSPANTPPSISFLKLKEDTQIGLRKRQMRALRVVQKVEVAFKFLLSTTVGSRSDVPEALKYITTIVSKLVGNKFGLQSQKTFVIGYFFLRFLCPALALPQTTFGNAVSPQTQKVCVLMSRLLQAAANGQQFQNPDMHYANKMIDSAQSMIDAFVCQLAGLTLTIEQKELLKEHETKFEDRLERYQHLCGKVSGARTCATGGDLEGEPIRSLQYFADMFKEEEMEKEIDEVTSSIKEKEKLIELVAALNREFKTQLDMLYL